MPELELLAKSEPKRSLKEHTEDCLLIFDKLKRSFPNVEEIAKDNRFWVLLRLAVTCHDLGKAHRDFQKVLIGKPKDWDFQRHELFSLPFVEALDLEEDELFLVRLIVAGHHKSFDLLRNKYVERYESDELDELTDDLTDRSFKTAFKHVDTDGAIQIAKELGVLFPNLIKPKQPLLLLKEFNRKKKELAQNFKLMLLFGAMKQCDHMGSAMIEELVNLDLIRFNFLQKQRQELIDKNADFYSHQIKASQIVGNSILTAPTGTGKTETAMLWLEKQIKERGLGCAFYILPFTASINAMWRRLGDNEKGLGKDGVGMLHGNLNAVLYQQFVEELGSVEGVSDQIKNLKKTFKTLQTPLKVVTPFQLLKHIFGLKGFEKGIFEWTGGYFIFDEIHAYDPSVLAQIIVLLEFAVNKCGVRVFIMTATLPTFLKERLKETLKFNGSLPYDFEADDDLYEKLKRHKIKVLDGEIFDFYKDIKADLENNKKVLVVCNTVLRAQQVFEELGGNKKGILLHGGFNGEDRAEKEKQLKDKKNLPKLLVGTQAIEVSLDIDYDVIYTEIAPFDALLQRFGRVNRKAPHEIKEAKPCFVFSVRNEKDKYIYSNTEIMDKTLDVLRQIEENTEGVVNERDLQEMLDIVYGDDFNAKDKAEFEKVYTYLKDSVSRLVPLMESENAEEDFYKMFDGIKVLPTELYQKFKERLFNFDFIGAEMLKVGIRKSEMARWFNDNIMEKSAINIPLSNGEFYKIDFFIVNLKYDEDLGLKKDEHIPASSAFLDESFG
jgi:CRISPR-associated endonuclease/helicase Cas3